MKKSRLTVLAVAGALAAGTALATMDAQKQFAATYPDAKGLAKCSTCHVKPMAKKGDAEVNAYGKALGKADKDGKYDFAKIEKADSDGDGVSNIDEIKKGTNPGDPASK
jgi:hypothetical protein